MKAGFCALLLLLCHLPVLPDNVLSRFKAPDGYMRVSEEPGSFASWLQQLPLKPIGTHTLTYNGAVAATDAYTAAVIDISVGKTDLQQCADAVMRLRGEYLYSQKRYAEISFNFVSGFKCDYLHFAHGYRYQYDKWVLKAKSDYSYPTFLKYMNLVFMYAGTLSLDKELHKVTAADDLKAGDVFIRGGSPGHCFIVMDVVQNSRHEKQFLLAQSFMPAQNIQVLQNGSPWFSMSKPSDIAYGELINFKYLKRFE